MSELTERITIEFSNLQRILTEFPAVEELSALSALEIAGTGALLHNFYGGVENLIKQMLESRGLPMPTGASWHRDLVNLASSEEIISETTTGCLRPYLAFRHFFSHAYAVDLDVERMQPLIETIEDVYAQIRHDIECALAGADNSR